MKKIKNRILIITILAVVETIAAVVGLTYVVIGIFNHSITIILGLVMLRAGSYLKAEMLQNEGKK